MKIFDMDSPWMQSLNRVADLVVLNLLTLVCCIPVVTAGASLTAMHYVALKMARNEECYIARDFFKSFKLNFKQGTIIWLIELFVIILMVGDFIIVNWTEISFGAVFKVVLTAIAFLVIFSFVFVYPVLAKFENTVVRTIKNSFLVGIMQFPKTILMMILTVAPVVLMIFIPQITPVVFLLGLSVPAWLSAKLYSKYFSRLEEQIMASHPSQPSAEKSADMEEDERIFKDELDPGLLEDSGIN